MTVAANILSQVYPDLTAHMSEEDRAYLAGALEVRRAQQGEPVIAHGEVSDRLYMIGEGALGITLPTPDGGELDLGRRGAGCWVGELGMIEPGSASATVSAATDVTLWILSHEAFETMRVERPCAAARIMEEISKDVATRMRACNSVLFKRDDTGGLEVVSKKEARGGFLGRLVHEVKDLFDLGGATPAGDVVPVEPLAPPMSLDTFLDAHPSFGRLPEEDREHLQCACDVKDFPDGHALIREGDSRDSVYLLLDGQVEVQVHRPREASFSTDRIMGPGEIIGLVAIVDRGRRSATCTARGKLKAAVLSLEAVSLLMGTRAPISCAFQYALASQLARDARNLNESLLHAAAHPDAEQVQE